MLLVIGALLAVSCGSNVDDSAQVDDSTADPQPSGEGFPMVGDHELKCSEGEGGNTDPGIQGVTADQIQIGVMADLSGLRPGLGQHTVEAMQAFVMLCNEHGGVNGRELVLSIYDTKLTDSVGAATQACAEVFATVGDGVVFDNESAQVQVDCGQLSVPGWSGSTAKSEADLTYFPTPSPPGGWFAAPGRYMSETYPEQITNGQMLYSPQVQVTEETKSKVKEAYENLFGFEFAPDLTVSIVETQWGSIVSSMRDQGVQYFYPVNEATNVAALLSSMEEQGFRPEVIDLNSQFYTPRLIEAAGTAAEGVHISLTQRPFEEAEDSDATSVYLEYLEKANPGAKPDSLGVLEFSAGMLFVEALHSLGDDISTEALDTALSEIHEWDAGGMHVPTNPGDNTRDQDCYMYVTVEGGAFVREYPATPEDGDVNGFRCYDDTHYELTANSGEGGS